MPFLMTDFYAPQIEKAKLENIQADTAYRKQQISEGERKLQAQKKLQELMQADIQQPTQQASVSDEFTPVSTQAGSLFEMANYAENRAKAIYALDPDLGMKMEEHAAKLKERASNISEKELDRTIKMHEAVANWVAPIKDQATADAARDQINAIHPGAWNRLMGNETEYSPKMAAKLGVLKQSSLTALDQARLQREDIKLLYEADIQKAELDNIHARTVATRVQTQLDRENITDKRAERLGGRMKPLTANQLLDAEEAITNRFAKKLDREISIIDKVKMLSDKPITHLFGEDEPSPRAVAVAEAEARIAAEEQAALDNLHRKYGDVATGKGATGTWADKPAQQFVQGKIYRDAKGNKARYNNGKWEPVK